MIALEKINQLYIGAGIILAALALIIIISLRAVFSAITVAGEIDESLLNVSTPRINRAKMEVIIKDFSEREFIPLDLQR